MSKKKACKKCKLFVDGDVCPACKSKEFSTIWQGRVSILDVDKSFIAKKTGSEYIGEYAIKVR